MRLPTSKITNPLTHQGIVLAIQTMAELIDGHTEKEAALQWAINVGWLVPHPRNRGEVCLTPSGQQMVYLFWKAAEEGRKLGREEIDLA